MPEGQTMVDQTEVEYVTHEECNARHGVSKWFMATVTALASGLVGLSLFAAGIGWSAQADSHRNSDRLESQGEMLREIHVDVREIRELQMQILRNGNGD
jgi:hypothetical protein